MSNPLDKYRRYNDVIRRLLLFTGLWPYDEQPNFIRRISFLIPTLVVFITICSILNFCRYHFTNLDLMLKALGVALSFLTMFQKTICFGFYRKRMIDLHTSLAINFDKDLDDDELRPILLSPLFPIYRPSMILSISTCTLIAMHWIKPVIAIAIQLWQGVDVVKYILPFSGHYPWKIEGWLYLAHYAFDIYAGIALGAFTTLIDSLFGYYVFQMSGQLRALSHRLTNMKSSDDYHKVISECVIRHQILIKCQNHLERIYGPIVLWMLMSNALCMCTLIYQASHMNSGKAALITVYIFMKSIQTLFYGWFGTFLTTENDKFRQSIYDSDWPGSSEKCLMIDVLIMMTYKPFVLKACSLSTISVDMFITVSNTALSYFFMLRTLEEGNNS